MSSRLSFIRPNVVPGPAARVQLAIDLKDHMQDILNDISSNEMSINYTMPGPFWMDQLDNGTSDLNRLFGLVSAALARERNALNPSVSLPSEILAEIFRHAGIRATTRASKVCHKWRVSSLSHPDLWISIDMADPNFSEDTLRLQLSRAGRSPLHLNFHILDEGTFFYNIKVPDNVEVLLLNARSISNISTRTFQTKIDMVDLESLHVTMGPRTLDQCLGSTPKLRHLSVDSVGYLLPNTSSSPGIDSGIVNSIAFLDNLHTLHLRGGHLSPQPVVDLLASLPHLQEVLLSNFKDYPNQNMAQLSHDSQPVVDTVLLRPLKLLVLKKIPLFFLYGFLNKISLPSTANMSAHDWPGRHLLHLTNGTLRSDAKAVYIHPHSRSATSDEENLTIYYQHELSISQITVKNCDSECFVLPSAIPTAPIETLVYLTDRPRSIFIWKGLGNLRNLSFTFTPGLHDGLPTTLESVLSEELIQNCPRLEYIGLVLKKATGNTNLFDSSRIGFKDRAESTILTFLEKWDDQYSKIFHSMCIQDHIKPNRWDICFPTFEAFIERFEIGLVSLELPAIFRSTTSLLKPRQFQPDIDPRSTSLSADRTAYTRWSTIL